MNIFIDIEQAVPSELYVVLCGRQICKPEHYYGPAIRDHYLIHYIHSGKGTFTSGGRTVELSAGEGFLITPDTVNYYRADKIDPWHYSWVGFKGESAEKYLLRANLNKENFHFKCTDDGRIENCFSGMMAVDSLSDSADLHRLSFLYAFLSILIDSVTGKIPQTRTDADKYVSNVIEFIKNNFSHNISISDLAKNIGLERSYLGSLFKQRIGLSIKGYLVKYRINRACTLLRTSDFSIGDIARSVGYTDPLLFSKMFKKNIGKSPSQFRQE